MRYIFALFFYSFLINVQVVAAKADYLSLSQIKSGAGYYQVVVIIEESDEKATVVNVSESLDSAERLNIMQLVSRYGIDAIEYLAEHGYKQEVNKKQLSIVNSLGERHIGIGTNYKEHQEEVDVKDVFLFPKIAKPTEKNSIITVNKNQLLDYEIEICAVFDRGIKTAADFEAAVKAFFVCGDFTDRAKLIRLVDRDNVTSGKGFTDAKSGSGRFPVGNRVVIPKNWQAFIDAVPLQLSVNGDIRQEAKGEQMIMKLDKLVSKILAEGNDTSRWQYRDKPVSMLNKNYIEHGQAILTGTPSGVIFQFPGFIFQLKCLLRWLFSFAWLDVSLVNYIIEQYIADAKAKQIYLQSGDQIDMEAGALGVLSIGIIETNASTME